MKSLNQLMQEVIQLSGNIETNYPELHKYLGETPVKIGNSDEKEITTEDLILYLETLKSLLKHHIETHKLSED